MKKKDILSMIIVSVGAIAGFVGSIWFPKIGMFIAGFCSNLVLLSLYGRHLANLAAKRIDKRVKDYITSKEF